MEVKECSLHEKAGLGAMPGKIPGNAPSLPRACGKIPASYTELLAQTASVDVMVDAILMLGGAPSPGPGGPSFLFLGDFLLGCHPAFFLFFCG